MRHARTACDQEFLPTNTQIQLRACGINQDLPDDGTDGFTRIQLRGEQTQPLEKHRYYLNCCRVITEETEVSSGEAPEKNSGGAPLSCSSAARGWGSGSSASSIGEDGAHPT